MKLRRPIEPDELAELSRTYGIPTRRVLPLDFLPLVPSKRVNRRGEVVFAIQNPSGDILLHRKRFYPDGVFRLPGGGIHWNESVEAALFREIQEETGLSAQVIRFVALIEYTFQGKPGSFPTYLFLLRSGAQAPQAADVAEQISAFRAVSVGELRDAARRLRELPGEWRVWGEFRAGAHDVLAEALLPA